MTPEHALNLKEKHRRLRDEFPDSLDIRVHRAISWLKKASTESHDPDAAFIFYWIAFNSAYSQDIGIAYHVSEKGRFKNFLNALLSFDNSDKIHHLIWEKYSQKISFICSNQYIFGPFWSYLNGDSSYIDWKERLNHSVETVKSALATKDTEIVLNELFDRLSVLRNQMIFGGATWAGSINRDQVRDGAELLGLLVPIFVELMMENKNYKWKTPIYPVVDREF